MNDKFREFRNPEYEGFLTSPAVLAAIEAVASGSVLDDESEAYRLWADGGREEEIIAELPMIGGCDEGDELFWGCQGVFARFQAGKWQVVNA